MNKVSESLKKFFDEYEKANNTFDVGLIASEYGDVFLFADPNGIKPPIKKEDFLKMLPNRRNFFETIGLKSRKIVSLEETRLADHYVMVRAMWAMQFEEEGRTIDDEISATYILYQKEDSLQIVFQLDHQDLMKRVQELGLR